MKHTGLVVQRQSGTGDMFRGRIMIPLCDSKGAVVGFTARLLVDQPDSPKYINTPQTVVYDKGRQVFGLHLAREAIRKKGFVVVAEGNLDVISSHQAGISNVVASAGTAMTEMHLRELKRFTSDIRLSFDADRAGIAATERVIPLAQKAGAALRIINIVGAKDPDELVRKDVKLWQKAIESSQDAPDWLIDLYKDELDLKTAPGKRAFTDALLPTIRALGDGVEREHYLKQIAKLTDTSLETLQSKLSSTKSIEKTLRRKITQNEPLDTAVMEYQKLQDHFLAMALSQPKLRDLLKNCQEKFFTDGPQRQLYNFLKQNPEIKNDTKLPAKLPNIIDYVKICSLQFEELYADLDYSDLREQAENLKQRLINRYVKNQTHLLANAMQKTENEKELTKLTNQADKLNKLIK
jgi:DNA primase